MMLHELSHHLKILKIDSLQIVKLTTMSIRHLQRDSSLKLESKKISKNLLNLF